MAEVEHLAEQIPMSNGQNKEWQLPKERPLKTPIPFPDPKHGPPKPPPLTPEHEANYATVLAAVSQWTSIPSSSAKNAPQEALRDHERMWLSRECLLRYLRATRWQPPAALKRLQATLTWRREYGADTFTPDYVSEENETGKQVLLGFDADARPCLYMNPARQNLKMSDRQIQFLCYMVDRAVDMLPPGQESTAYLINFKGAPTNSMPSLAQGRTALSILQDHNPERLGRALLSDMPWFVNVFLKLITPFIDPATKDKIRFNDDARNYVPPETLWSAYGGDLDFVYDHATYWPALAAETDKRRRAQRERWEAGGKMIGEFEEYLRGGDCKSLSEVLKEGRELLANEDEEAADTLAAEVEKLKVLA